MKVEFDIGLGILCAEIDGEGTEKAIAVTLKRPVGKTSRIVQDIARIGPAVSPDGNTVDSEHVCCRIYSDPDDDDYTHEHLIQKQS